MISSYELSLRRNALLDQMEDGSAALVFSGVPKYRLGQQKYPFEVNRNFYYLTGVDEEDCVLILLKSEGERKEYLLIPPYEDRKRRWYGKRISQEEASLASGIRNILYSTSLNARMDAILNGSLSEYGLIQNVYLDFGREEKIADDVTTLQYRDSLLLAYGNLSAKDIAPLIATLRRKKSGGEIKEIIDATLRARLGYQSALSQLRVGVHESQLYNAYIKAIMDDGEGEAGPFYPTFALGEHTLYPLDGNSSFSAKPGQICLMEIGACSFHYGSHVVRSIPVGGKFDEQQALTYKIVRDCAKQVCLSAKEGMSIASLTAMAKQYLQQECRDHGLIQTDESVDNYLNDGFIQHVGLNYPEVSSRSDLLEENNILSISPGLYFEKLGYAIRFGEMVRVDKKEPEILTNSLISSPEEIEKFYGRKSK